MTAGEKEEFRAAILDELFPIVDMLERPSKKVGMHDEWRDLHDAVREYAAALMEVI